MENNSVEQIKNLAIAAQGTMPIQVDGDASIAIVPEGFKVISTEKFNQLRDRFRGVYATLSIQSFVEYITNRNLKGVKAFVSTTNGLRAESIFNLGDEGEAGHADDLANLTLEKKPEFKALERADGQRFDQQDLIDWLDDWADFVSAHNSVGLIPHDKAIRALRKVKINRGHEVDSSVHDLGYKASVTEQVGATGVDENLPEYFIMKTESYKGLEVADLKISLRISTKDTSPTFVLRFVGKDAHEQQRAEEFIELLENQLAGNVDFYQGTFTA
ncbi:DUF2303 family protein [Acinetobacter wuhouensis]|uniref:DUF2303 family protein n=1 Tax=Acinetobacter wuhouensis TaxID=1879050 RepID=A0A4Q7AJS5_9GAMM|nr:DUF2303 family protein [Acinetobacter wuhouensis]RZG47018.1 DUF2303 family protein [Acinetobacter wuhouensis]